LQPLSGCKNQTPHARVGHDRVSRGSLRTCIRAAVKRARSDRLRPDEHRTGVQLLERNGDSLLRRIRSSSGPDGADGYGVSDCSSDLRPILENRGQAHRRCLRMQYDRLCCRLFRCGFYNRAPAGTAGQLPCDHRITVVPRCRNSLLFRIAPENHRRLSRLCCRPADCRQHINSGARCLSKDNQYLSPSQQSHLHRRRRDRNRHRPRSSRRRQTHSSRWS